MAKQTNRFTVLLNEEQLAWLIEQGGSQNKSAYVKKLIDADMKRASSRARRIKKSKA